MVIKRIGPLSCAKIAGVVHAILGLFMGAMFSLIALAGGFPTDPAMPVPPMFGVLMGFSAIIFLPLFYGVMGFVMTLIFAFVYNVLAAIVGGIEIQVE
jgi:hypothetical protein